MFEDMEPIADTVPRRCSLPTLRSFSSKESGYGDKNDDRRLPPLPRVEPLPPGPFNPLTSNVFAPSPPSSQDSFSVKSSWPSSSEHGVSPPSPASSAEGSLRETFSTQKAFGWPNDFSSAEIMALVAPRNINRKPPLQQLCGRKRKEDMISGDLDDQREKHRIAEGNRRKNLSQLHRELDSRVHDFFLERAGWNPAKSLPQSKEHIVQGAIFLIDFMLVIIAHLLRQEKQIPSKLSENLQSQMRCMHLQQQVSSLQQQNQVAQQQLRAVKQENEALAERNRALEFQLKSYEQMFRSPKSEATSPKPVLAVPENKQKKLLPGLRVFCDEVAAIGPEPGAPMDPPHTGSSQTFGNPFFRSTPPTTNPSSPVYQQSSQTSPCSRRESFTSMP